MPRRRAARSETSGGNLAASPKKSCRAQSSWEARSPAARSGPSRAGPRSPWRCRPRSQSRRALRESPACPLGHRDRQRLCAGLSPARPRQRRTRGRRGLPRGQRLHAEERVSGGPQTRHGLHPRRRQRRGLGARGRGARPPAVRRRRACRSHRQRRGDAAVPPRTARLARASRARRRGARRALRQLRPRGPHRRAQMGAARHRRLRRQHGSGHDLRRIRRRPERLRAVGHAGRRWALHLRVDRKRRLRRRLPQQCARHRRHAGRQRRLQHGRGRRPPACARKARRNCWRRCRRS